MEAFVYLSLVSKMKYLNNLEGLFVPMFIVPRGGIVKTIVR